MPDNELNYLDLTGLTRFKGKIQDILDTKVDKENGKYIVTVDSELSSTSTNPVQNSAVKAALDTKVDKENGKYLVTVDSALSSSSTNPVQNSVISAMLRGTDDVISDILTWATNCNGMMCGKTNTTTTSLPSGVSNLYGLAFCESWVNVTNTWIRVFWAPTASLDIYQNSKTNNGEWLGWTKMPNRAEITQINSDLKTPVEVNDLNDAIDPEKYYIFNSGASNTPGYSYGFVKAFKDANNVVQYAFSRGGTNVFYRNIRSRSSNGVWGEWEELPTRSEITQINNDISITTVDISNCNDAVDPRKIYTTTPSTTNKPAGANYWFIHTFGKSGKALAQIALPMNSKSPDIRFRNINMDGESDGWINYTLEAISITFTTNEYYSEEVAFRCYKSGRLVHLYGTLKCNSPYATSPGYKVISGSLPRTYSSIYVAVPSTFGDLNGTSAMRCMLSGTDLYFRHGTVGNYYDVSITYMCQ